MKMKACLALLALVAMATSANAARLVVLAVNSGTGTIANAFPPVAAGAKGFLIGIDNSTDPVQPLAFQDMTFSGPGLVQRLAPNAAASELIPSQNVQLRSEALSANGSDAVAGSTFGANDSWWWNRGQNPDPPGGPGGLGGFTLSPVSTGIVGGLPGGPMTMTGTYNPSGTVPAGQWRMAYIVATGDVNITGILAGGQDGYNFVTGALNPSIGGSTKYASPPAVLRFSDGQIAAVPEPSTIALTALALVGLGVGAWKRRK